MQVLGRELTTDEIIHFVRDYAAQTRRHKDCHDCLYIDMALTLADEVEKLNRRAFPENKPLTLEQLRRMDGEPVWIAYPRFPEDNEWRILKGIDSEPDEDGDIGAYFADDVWESLEGYGRDLLAYARRPEDAT